jgi:hypothetical protein
VLLETVTNVLALAQLSTSGIWLTRDRSVFDQSLPACMMNLVESAEKPLTCWARDGRRWVWLNRADGSVAKNTRIVKVGWLLDELRAAAGER